MWQSFSFKPTKSLYPADILIAIVAFTLPWSTSLPAIFLALWLVALAPSTDFDTFRDLMRRPICFLPVGFFVLATLGTLWSSVPWGARLYSVGPAAKFLVVPLLIYQFQRSTRGVWVLLAFFVSCTCLMIYSWAVAFAPGLALKPNADYGVPLKNYIDQSQEFALCAVGILYIIVQASRSRQTLKALLLIIIAAAFFANMAFIVVSRTALVTIPFMIAAFVALHLSRRGLVFASGAVIALLFTVWIASPTLRTRTATIVSEFQRYEASNAPTSAGLRIEFWRKSLRFWSEAPFIGQGTGSVRSLFTISAAGQTGASAEIIANPHNQTLYTAIQWGALGVFILYSMWLSHLLLFRGTSLAHWVGLLVVVQNIMTSAFNSHLFDFVPGWIYVLGVGVAGGMVLSSEVTPSRNSPVESHS